MPLANRVSKLTPSSTLAITAKAKLLRAEGHDVIGLGAGEPDFNTPEHIIEAAYQAMKEGHTKYTPSAGIPQLREAIVHKLKRDNNLTYNVDQVVVCSGAKHALYNIFQVLVNPGDEVIIPTPYWVSYPEQVKLAEGIPVFVEGKEENQFKITPEQLEEVITPKTKAVIINSPSNPTGSLYRKHELAALADVCMKHNIFIISDEIYEKLIYGDVEHVSIASLSDEVWAKTFVVNGMSKPYSMTGWRIGYVAGPQPYMKAIADLSSHSTSNPTSVAQYAALAALEGTQEPLERMKKAFQERRDKIYAQLIELPGVTCVQPEGAFYLFPNVQQVVQNSPYPTVDEWAKGLLEEEKVALVPGSAFGAPHNVRISYATSLEALEEAIKRIRRFMEK
ncbi:aminotransferase class I and II [Caldalkalibacillus thermarum TA2.A1]|uniref:Aminotransferase n=1 Tax=Caldalkalibacillus thermarum (strain TA2.A1) TaxID=986075 RepID=F5L8V2_CALTT|nr:pyridoxal phosphate-dependent aminotransferase [Caldalkalibacillus thermarum]EGL82234.1 aminotransferase class I and II [Caldalkalibacillus thermarum TA2.A1]QZT32750.1 pyridoxal phosphate-dependent aminotransferase [Caldalkalibacillus thermarum TA2.A1]